MDISGFSNGGTWYKGNLHAHSTDSDGKKTPAELVALYKQAGYDFLAITDHDVYSAYQPQLGDESFLILSGMEASIYYICDPDNVAKYQEANSTETWSILYDKNHIPICDKVHHINVFPMTEKATLPHGTVVPPQVVLGTGNQKESLQAMVDTYVEQGHFVVYNHPTWSRMMPQDILGVSGISALEIYNHTIEERWGAGDESAFFDMTLRCGGRLLVAAGDDNHNKDDYPDNFGGYVMVKASELTHNAIMKSMVAGNYYASTGMEIYDWGIADNQVYVHCSNARKINFFVGDKITDGITVNSTHGLINHGTYPLKGHETYVRIECIGPDHSKAWTNPIFL